MKMEDKLKFGKYKGDTLNAVLNKDPGYLCWALRNSVISLTTEDALKIITIADEKYLDDLEIEAYMDKW